jgi:NDP-sugar pyrophosphorylase family protein
MKAPRHALLLTAGLGTRLQPLTAVRTKAAIPVAGEPLARRLTRWLVSFGVTDVVANLHHLPATLTAVLGDGSDLGARVRYSWEQPAVLGSAGGPRHALSIVGQERFLIVNGDVLSNLDVPALGAAHEAAGALVTLALVPNREHLKYGGVVVARDGSVTGFVRRGPAAAGSFHFIGTQVVEAGVFRPLADNQPINSIGGVYDELIASQPGSVRAFVSDATYWDIGTVADYWNTSAALSNRSNGPGRSILWDNVQLGAGCVLDECIVTDDVEVPAGATYRRMILLKTEGGLTAVPFQP